MADERSQRPCVVVDTTTLLRSILTKSNFHTIIKAFDDCKFALVVSNEILLEYEEILKALGGPSAWLRFRDLLDAHSGDVICVDPSFFWNAIKADQDDNKFVDAAVAGDAEFIVTDDSHFNVLNTDLRLVVRPLHPLVFMKRFCFV
jgi:putative PIN family toxin of toxin-antitoxin system